MCNIYSNERKNKSRIIKSSDIGPVKINNPGAIYKSRPISSMSSMIQSAISTRTLSTGSLTSQSITSEIDKRKFVDNRVENDLNEGKSNKKIKLVENENNDYLTEELELDININPEQNNNEKYITQEIDFDI
ncbi:unnamed protein product [Rhizophagus irregularis]|nr:unnamed protein product [Rhizophagus irregularis]CAB5216693.1 unnamed protein product [Rhizophagus irregularis]